MVPSQGGCGDALLWRMPPYLTYLTRLEDFVPGLPGPEKRINPGSFHTHGCHHFSSDRNDNAPSPVGRVDPRVLKSVQPHKSGDSPGLVSQRRCPTL